jgi:hypothetical protein
MPYLHVILPFCESPENGMTSCKLSTTFPLSGIAKFQVSSTSIIPESGFKLQASTSASNCRGVVIRGDTSP